MSKILTPEHLHLLDFKEFITSFNILILTNWDGKGAIIDEQELVKLTKLIYRRTLGEDVQFEFDVRLKSVFEAVGWKIQVEGFKWHVSF